MRRPLMILTAVLVALGSAVQGATAADPLDNGTNAAVAWALGYTGAGQTIAVIDSGVDAGHGWFSGGNIAEEACFSIQTSDLLPLCWPKLEEFGRGKALPVRADGRPDRWDDHGMQVTGAAVGAASRREGFPRGPRGIAPDARVVAIKNTFEVEKSGARLNGVVPNVRALEWLASDPSRELAAVSLSWDFDNVYDGDDLVVDFGTEKGNCDAAAEQDLWTRRAVRAIAKLRSRGVVTVASAPNEASEPVGFPACHSSVVGVGAVTRDGAIPDGYPKWPAIDVFATGIDVLLPRIAGTHVPARGASYATPIVAGAIALYRQAHPRASADEIVRRLEKTGKRVRVGTIATRRVLQVDKFLDIGLPSGRLRADCLQPHFVVRNGSARGFFRLTCAPADRPLHRIAVTLDGPGGSLDAEDLDIRPLPLESYQKDVITIGPPASPAASGDYRLCALLYTTAERVWPARSVCRDYEV